MLITNSKKDFNTTMCNALKNYTDLQWLGKNSPLASPYFLGDFLNLVDYPETIAGRGRALQQVLFKAATFHFQDNLPTSRQALDRLVEKERSEMGNGGPVFSLLLLDLRYFRHYYSPRTLPNRVGAIPDFMAISKSAFFRYLDQARNQLQLNLLRMIRPNLRLEQPILTTSLVGREPILQACLSDLAQSHSVALSGIGGIGKTSLGIQIRESWPQKSVFWYTFRPGLNDYLTSILFALGHFLQKFGRTNLWSHLMANEGIIKNVQQAIGFLRADLQFDGGSSLLLCFDEVDLLQTNSSQPRHGAHKLVLEFLDGLRKRTPLLLIGQRSMIDTDSHYVLQPLIKDDINQLILNSDVQPSDDLVDTVYRVTHGNPRLVELLLSLLESGEKDAVFSFAHLASIKPLFNRLWKRLDESEKQLLLNLAVFRSYVPIDELQGKSGIDNLRQRQLIKIDEQGGCTIVPFFREMIYNDLSSEHLQLLHKQAANIRAEFGQYTQAAYHLTQAKSFQEAIQLWYDYQDVEIAQGNVGAANAVFEGIESKSVGKTDRKKLKIIQNRLALLFGEAERVLSGMESYDWHIGEKLSVEAMRQLGEANWQLGKTEDSLENLQTAIDSLRDLFLETVRLHTRRGQISFDLINYDLAEGEAIIAQAEIEVYLGVLKLARGQYKGAQPHFEKALRLAKNVEDMGFIARIHYYLAMATGNLGDMKGAHQHAEVAMDYYKQIGDRLKLEGMRAELAGFYLNVGQFSEMIEPAERALNFFEGIKHDIWISHLTSNLAEAYFETGNLEIAETYALRAISSENIRVQPYAYYTLGQIQHAKHKPEAAEQSFLIGIETAEKTEDKFISAYLHRIYGLFFMKEGLTDKGLTLLEIALELFNLLNIPHEIENTQLAINNCK